MRVKYNPVALCGPQKNRKLPQSNKQKKFGLYQHKFFGVRMEDAEDKKSVEFKNEDFDGSLSGEPSDLSGLGFAFIVIVLMLVTPAILMRYFFPI